MQSTLCLKLYMCCHSCIPNLPSVSLGMRVVLTTAKESIAWLIIPIRCLYLVYSFSRTIDITDVGQDYNLNNSFYLFFGLRAAGLLIFIHWMSHRYRNPEVMYHPPTPQHHIGTGTQRACTNNPPPPPHTQHFGISYIYNVICIFTCWYVQHMWPIVLNCYLSYN